MEESKERRKKAKEPKAHKRTKANLEIAFPEAKINEIELMSKLSIRESIISGYETVYTWGKRDFDSNNHIFKV
jgi:Lauroyl/myristoyl acyltransferase